jgi:hypothetical protein
MTEHIDQYIPPFRNAAHEREWLVQEAAMRQANQQSDLPGADARDASYRLIARRLREEPAERLPADFAEQLARQLVAGPARTAAPRLPGESILTAVLLGVLAVATGVVVALYGSTWLPSFTLVLPHPRAPAAVLLLAFAGCLGASWLLARWPSHGRRFGG